MKIFYSSIFILSFLTATINAQTIELHSIDNLRMPFFDNGYTLNGSQMVNSRSKLLNTANFGLSGTFPKSINITDAYAFSGDLEFIGNANIDMFYFGIFYNQNSSLNTFTSAEVDSLYEWSLRGGKLIVTTGSPNGTGFNPDILNSKWGFSLALQFPTTVYPTTQGNNSALFNGPFGTVSQAFQGGTSQGYFSVYPGNSVILANDGAGHPTMYLDCNTLDLIVADGDVYTTLGQISNGNAISNNNDKLLANTIAYMDALEDPPVIIQNGNDLSTGTYPGYQWFLNGNPISGATGMTYTAVAPGTYSVQVSMLCGCTNVASNEIIILSNGNEINSPVFTITPNPATDVIAVDFNSEPITAVEITDITGRIVFSDNNIITGDHKIQLIVKDLKKGMYWVSVYGGRGITAKRRFIKI